MDRVSNTVKRELLERAVIFFRRGQVAAGNLSYISFAHFTQAIPVVQDCINAGDFLQAADVLEALIVNYQKEQQCESP